MDMRNSEADRENGRPLTWWSSSDFVGWVQPLLLYHLIRISSAQNQRFRIYSRLYNDFDLGISIQYVDSLSQMEPGKGAACSFLRSFFRPFLGGLRIYTPPPSSNPKKRWRIGKNRGNTPQQHPGMNGMANLFSWFVWCDYPSLMRWKLNYI